MGNLNALTKAELAELGASNGVEVDPDTMTKDEMIEALNDEGVTEDSSDDAADESRSSLPGASPGVLPDYDPETARGVTPLPAGPRNPAQDYDDDARG